MLWHGAPCRSREHCPTEDFPIPGGSKGLGYRHNFHMQTNRSRAHTLATYGATYPLLPSPQWSQCVMSPGTRVRYQTTGDSPYTQTLKKLFTLADPRLAYLASLLPSCANYNKGSCQHFLTLPPDQPCCFPTWPLWHHMPPPLETCE